MRTGFKGRGFPFCIVLCLWWHAGAPLQAAPRSKRSSAPPTVSQLLGALPLKEKVAQLVIIPFYGEAPSRDSEEYQQFAHLIRDVRVGGLVLINRVGRAGVKRSEPYAMAAFLNRMQRLARLPLLVGGDFERGPSMRVERSAAFPHPMSFTATGDPENSRYAGLVTARESRALGVHWILFPIADVNNNPDNPIINIRSFGEDPQEVSAHVKAYIEGAHSVPSSPVLTTVKHFPGHGDTATDSHLNLATISADRARLDEVELLPFRAAISAGVDSVMTAHIAVPALDAPDLPATLSKKILTGLLRKEMGFRGLIVTDALNMSGIAKGFEVGEAAVRALEAGADVLLMPANPQAAIRAVEAAVTRGRLSKRRIDESLGRLLEAKQRLGLFKRKLVDLEAIAEVINAPETEERAQRISDSAVTAVKNEGNFLPLQGSSTACFVILSENRHNTQGHLLLDELAKRVPAAPVELLDPLMSGLELEQKAQRVKACEQIVVAAFASVTDYRGSAALAGGYPAFLESVIASGRPVLLGALGNPYLLRDFPKVSAYLATYSPSPPSEIAFVKAVFGEIPIRGRLPVTIPGQASRGDGLQIAARAR